MQVEFDNDKGAADHRPAFTLSKWNHILISSFEQYERGHKLSALALESSNTTWLDKLVVHERVRYSRYKLWDAKTDSVIEMDLNHVNHFEPLLMSRVYANELSGYLELCRKIYSKALDCVVGLETDLSKLIDVQLEVKRRGILTDDWGGVQTVRRLCEKLVEKSPSRRQGNHRAQPVCIVAPAGAGKSWLVRKAVFLIAQGGRAPMSWSGYVPLLIFLTSIKIRQC